MPIIREQIDKGGSVRLSPRGTSMLPMLREGVDSVVLSPLPDKLKKYDLPLYQREDGSYVLHRIIEAGDEYICMGDNQFHAEAHIKPEQMIAYVTAFYRGNRKIKADSFGYLLYYRFWCATRRFRRWFRRRSI